MPISLQCLLPVCTFKSFPYLHGKCRNKLGCRSVWGKLLQRNRRNAAAGLRALLSKTTVQKDNIGFAVEEIYCSSF